MLTGNERNSVKMFLGIANKNGWKVGQLDVKTAYLNANLEEEIYLEQPDGFRDKNHPEYCILMESK